MEENFVDKRDGVCYNEIAPSTKHQAPSTKHQAPSTKHQALFFNNFHLRSILSIFILTLVFTFAACGDDSDDGDDSVIGTTGPCGGIIFHYSSAGFDVQGNTCYYLEAAPSDITSKEWASSGKETTLLSGTFGTGIGTGKNNTTLILTSGADINAPAALACKNANYGSKSDWFLPSKDELDLMYKNLKNKGLGGFSNDWYWSSSQNNNLCAWSQDFSDGLQTSLNSKNYPFSVRAVRAY
jgi:hypothetical protein